MTWLPWTRSCLSVRQSLPLSRVSSLDCYRPGRCVEPTRLLSENAGVEYVRIKTHDKRITALKNWCCVTTGTGGHHLAIVSNAAFMISDRLAYLNQPTGYDESAIFSFRVNNFDPDINLVQQYALDEQAIRSLDGVVDVAMTNWVPLSGSGDSSSMHTSPPPEMGRGVRAAYQLSSDSALNTLGATLIAGRNFRADEVVHSDNRDNLPTTAIVTKDLAEEMFPDESALGKPFIKGKAH